MQNNYTLPTIDLQLFNGAAAGGAGAAGDGGAAAPAQDGAGTLPKAGTTGRTGSSRRSRTGAFDNVVFGKQDVAASGASDMDPAAGGDAQGKGKSGVTVTSDTREAKRAAFKAMIEGEHKEDFEEMFQQTFNRRFRNHKEMEESLAAQKPIMDMLMQKHNIQDGDVAKLLTAIEQDDTYWEEGAEKAGLSVEQYRKMQKMEQENADLRRAQQRQLGQQMAQQKLAEWQRDAESIREVYPSFNLDAELQSDDFKGLLKAGIGLQQAYELIHMEEIKEATARNAAATAGQQLAAKIKTKAARPSENGTSTSSAVIVKDNVSNLSRAERAEAAKRALRGEKITF